MLTDLDLTNMPTCCKRVWADLFKSLPLRSSRFGMGVELTARLTEAAARICEIPISYSGRTYAKGKKIAWRDGLAVSGGGSACCLPAYGNTGWAGRDQCAHLGKVPPDPSHPCVT